MHRSLRITYLSFLAGVFALTAPARGQTDDVEIVGFTPNRVLMKWTVTNHGQEPISRLVFPVDRVNRVDLPPDGWEIESFERLQAGNLVFRSTSPAFDISRGSSLEFKCNLDQRALRLHEGTVRVGLRNGSTVEVPGVLLPASHSVWQVYGLPVFLAALLGVVVLARLLRRSRTASGGHGDSPEGPKNGDSAS